MEMKNICGKIPVELHEKLKLEVEELGISIDVQMPILTADGNVLPDGVGLYQYDGETLLAFPVHVALGAAEPIEAKNPLIILVDKPAQSLKASSCMLPLTSSGNVLFAEGEKLQESFDESKLIDYGSIEEFQMNH